MILETPTLRPAAVPDEMPVRPLDSVAPRTKRGYVHHVGSAEIAARRAAPREFKTEGGYIWQRRTVAWKKICTEFLPIGFVISQDGRTAGLDTILPDASTVTLSAAAIAEHGGESFSQWAAYCLLDVPDVRATGFWIRSVVPTLRDVRFAHLTYLESEERSSLHLIRLAEKVTGRTLRPATEQ
jgi:hypothetical protein